MDHVINDIVQRIRASIYNNRDIGLTDEDMDKEIQAYVSAINELEKYYYGEAQTKIKAFLYKLGGKRMNSNVVSLTEKQYKKDLLNQEARKKKYIQDNYTKWNDEGMALRKKRLEHGFSLWFIADKLGTSASRIGRLEKGEPVSQAKHLTTTYNLLFDHIELRKSLLKTLDEFTYFK